MDNFNMDILNQILLSSILDHTTVQEMFDRVYKKIHLPLICFDVSFRLIAYAFEHPFSFIHWEYIASLGQAPEAFIDDYNYLNDQEKMVSLGKSQIFDAYTCDGFAQACGPVNVDGRLVGYCGTMLDGTSYEDGMRINDALIRTISILLRESPLVISKGTAQMSALLSAAGMNTEDIETFKKDNPPPYLFGILKNTEAGLSTLLYARNYLDARLPILYSVETLDTLFIMFCSVKGENLEKPAEMLSYLSDKYGFACGISDYFDDPEEAPNAQSQAMLALAAAGKTAPSGLVDFRDYYLRILYLNAIGYLGTKAAVNPQLQKLKDEPQGSEELMQTLYAYLKNNRKMAVTAKELNVHKNTVLYRIRRISELLGVNLEDNRTAYNFFIALLVDKHITPLSRDKETEVYSHE